MTYLREVELVTLIQVHVQFLLFFVKKKTFFFLQSQHNRGSITPSTFKTLLTPARVQIFLFPFLHHGCGEQHRPAVESDMHSWSEAHANMLHVVGMMRLPEVSVSLLPRCLPRTPRITSNQLTMTSFFSPFFIFTCVRCDNKASAHICLVLPPHAVIRRPILCKYLERLKDN